MNTPAPSVSSSAWDQFLIGKRSMLSDLDEARDHSKNLRVQTSHGPVAEASFRAWLETFLPQRYGVTAGYIRGQRLNQPYNYAHFDVIVYDKLQSPILWKESNKDKSDAGRFRIVPAEFVHAVIEVKTALTRSTAKEVLEKLSQLKPLMAKIDARDERYPTYLRAGAVLAAVFFELRRADSLHVDLLKTLGELRTLNRTFYGGTILRGEGLHPDNTGSVRLYDSDEPMAGSYDEKAGMLGNVAFSESRSVEGKNLGEMVTWIPNHFSDFAFDLLALLNGTYRPGMASSFHGLDLTKYPGLGDPD